MDITQFIFLLTGFSAVTALATEAVKKTLDSLSVRYASNLAALITALVVGSGGMFFYYILNRQSISAQDIVFIFLMGLFNWIGSMTGYDKVRQALEQLRLR